jgi:hypothetical protein
VRENRTCEHESGSDPLPLGQRVAEDDDGGQDREELPRRRDDGAGQRTEVTHAHEDEILKTKAGRFFAPFLRNFGDFFSPKLN